MSKNLKKFLKWFLIIVVVVGSISATVFVFYKNYKAKQVVDVDLVKVLSSEYKESFDSEFDKVANNVVKNGETEWFIDLKTTSNKLDSVLNVLTNYYIDTGFVVKEKNISETYSAMITTRNVVTDMCKEYNIKSTSAWFPPLVGANDIYKAYTNYLVNYAKFISSINSNIVEEKQIEVISDIKFSIIDLYSRIIKDTFSKLIDNSGLKIVQSDANVDEINKHIVFENFYLSAENAFSPEAVKFVENYQICNKSEFAKTFKTSISNNSTINENSSANQKAAFYFNEVF